MANRTNRKNRHNSKNFVSFKQKSMLGDIKVKLFNGTLNYNQVPSWAKEIWAANPTKDILLMAESSQTTDVQPELTEQVTEAAEVHHVHGKDCKH